MQKDKLFQSTHPRRVRRDANRDIVANLLFQSTHPRRVRPAETGSSLIHLVFQSTHPRRVRPCTYLTQGIITVSIHAPTQGATTVMSGICIDLRFQSTHPRRVRHQESMQLANLYMFQSTHPRRVRHFSASLDDNHI